MCTVNELVESLSKQLNDHEPGHEYKRWCKQTLIDYLHAAIGISSNADKQGFTNEKTVTLEQGCYHCVCDDCDEVIAVMSIGGDSCQNVDEASKRYSGVTKYFNRSCASSDDEDSESASFGVVEIQEATKCCFTTENEVAAGTVARILCYKAPDLSTIDPNAALPSVVCGALRGQILQLALSQARLLDSESEHAIAASRQHLEVAAAFANLSNSGDS